MFSRYDSPFSGMNDWRSSKKSSEKGYFDMDEREDTQAPSAKPSIIPVSSRSR